MIDVDDKAVEKLKISLSTRPDCDAVRISVISSGCGGYAYHMEYAVDKNFDDTLIEKEGIFLVVDSKSLVHLRGTRLEYERVGLNEGFKFVNPNVSGECGCGESFYV